MANVTITRPDGSTEQITLADAQEAGYEYYPFVCSDGVTRYALLGEQGNANASHLWIERNGVRKYALKSPVTIPSGTFGKVLNAWNMNASDTFTATVPDKITVLKAVITFGNNATQEKYIGVTPGKSYRIDLTNIADSGSAGNVLPKRRRWSRQQHGQCREICLQRDIYVFGGNQHARRGYTRLLRRSYYGNRKAYENPCEWNVGRI